MSTVRSPRPVARPVVDQVVSADGTVIGWHRSGKGPTAVLLHGTSGDKSDWGLASPWLADELTLLAVDRRGRGRSGLGEPYAFEREVEDVAAIAASLDEPAHLVGHSYGGAVALAAVAAGVPACSLVLYEPATGTRGDLDLEQLASACEAAIAAGDPDGSLTIFYEAVGERAALELMRAWQPVYDRFRRDAHTIAREVRAAASLPHDLGEGLDVPVLLLHGTTSHAAFVRTCEELALHLPTAEVAVLDGQGHLGPAFAPEAFAARVLEFTRRVGPSSS